MFRKDSDRTAFALTCRRPSALEEAVMLPASVLNPDLRPNHVRVCTSILVYLMRGPLEELVINRDGLERNGPIGVRRLRWVGFGAWWRWEGELNVPWGFSIL